MVEKGGKLPPFGSPDPTLHASLALRAVQPELWLDALIRCKSLVVETSLSGVSLLRINSSSTVYYLCDLGQVTLPLCASISFLK